MTVTYTAEVATCKAMGCFLKLLWRWRGSIYKLVWMDLLLFLSIYYMLNFTYRLLLNGDSKRVFENIVHYCNSYSALIPLSFVLGFYVTIVMQRWWDQYMTIPWPDPLAVYVSAYVIGQDERSRVMRRTVMRYACLCHTIAMTLISPRVKKRFPTLNHLVEAGLLLDNEKQIIEDMNASFPKPPKHWISIVWASSIIMRARKEGRIRDDFAVKTIIDELNKIRGRCGVLFYYDSISIPLVYTQVVTLAVYSFFLSSVMARQWTEKEVNEKYENFIDLYFPIFTTLEFFFYMGWLKVAESLICPFGEDDDDFEVNWMIDRNLQVSYLIVDEMHHEHPELVRDQYWDEVFPSELPYANEADIKRESLFAVLSGVRVDVSEKPSKVELNGKSNHNMPSEPTRRLTFSDVVNRIIGNPQQRQSSDIGRRSSADEQFVESDHDQTLTNQTSTIITIPSVRQLFMRAEDTLTPENVNSPSNGSNASIAGNESDKDDFENLKALRQRERIERDKRKVLRNLDKAKLLTQDTEPQVTEPNQQRDGVLSTAPLLVPIASSTPLSLTDSVEQPGLSHQTTENLSPGEASQQISQKSLSNQTTGGSPQKASISNREASSQTSDDSWLEADEATNEPPEDDEVSKS